MLMATKLGRVVTYHEGLPSTKLHDPLVTQSCKIIWQTKIFISPLLQCLGTMPNLAGWWKLLLIKSHYPSFMWSCGISWKTKTLKSSLPQCLWPPNLVVWWLVVAYYEGVSLTKSHDSLIMLSWEITWRTKHTPLLPQRLWLPNVAGWHIMRSSYL